ncbi:MAG: hypothetical protein L0332_21065 [Chloroflexi bacterium]|nr:hypothetical protein [Chloroflexota bacterium]MCI0578458.1 hypothetical protein [Chloroflexota bacterium]MCI0643904.1 hypothetical protein [Chloroflexota bacterium]MCI0729186.1 hypothetical protein [Chloroflexota bacterium]
MASRFAQLQGAVERYSQLWLAYQEECLRLGANLRTELASFLECPSENISWLGFAENEVPAASAVKYDPDWQIWLDDVAFWHFRFGIELGDKLLQFNFSVKRPEISDRMFLVKLRDKEVEVRNGDFSKLFEELYHQMTEFLVTDFENFIHRRTRQRGFKVTDKNPSS